MLLYMQGNIEPSYMSFTSSLNIFSSSYAHFEQLEAGMHHFSHISCSKCHTSKVTIMQGH